jgi:hypothetical protein
MDILQTPLFLEQDPETQARIVGGLQKLASRQPPTLEEVKQQFRQLAPIDQLMTKKRQVSKREQKQLEKEKQMVYLKHVEKLKP